MDSIKEFLYGKPIDPNNPPPDPVYPGKHFKPFLDRKNADRDGEDAT